jgi:hypothetical protein
MAAKYLKHNIKASWILIAVIAICSISISCKSDSEKARTMLNNAHALMRDQKGEEAKKTLKNLLDKYPHTEEATEANKLLDVFQVAERVTDIQVQEIQSKEIEGALQLFSFDIGRYPTQKEGLKALFLNPGINGWQGPYMADPKRQEEITGKFDYVRPGRNGADYLLTPK